MSMPKQSLERTDYEFSTRRRCLDRHGSGLNSPLSRRSVFARTAAVAATALLPVAPSPVLADQTEDPTVGRRLLFADHFATLDASIWHAGPKATTFDTGFYGRSAFSRTSGEDGFNPYQIIDDPLAGDGKALQISAKYLGRPMHVPSYYGNNLPEYQWISGNIQTAKPDGTILKGWRNGYFEARMWVPRHPLSFPAFWLMNARSILFPQTSIELDIVEHKGWELDRYGAYLHEWGKPGEHHEGIGVPSDTDLTLGYRRYGMLVEGAQCSLYLDRKPVRLPGSVPVRWTIGRSQEMDAAGDVFWPLVTLAMRSDVPFPNPLRDEDRTTHLRIDYVQVFGES